MDVQNEGLRRIIILALVSWYAFFIAFGFNNYKEIFYKESDIQDFTPDNTLSLYDQLNESIANTSYTFDWMGIYELLIMFIIIPIGFSISIKAINWIIEGFKKGSSSK